MEGNMAKIQKVRIYDMDGTIVCSLHRYRTTYSGDRIDLEYWRDNQHKAMEDSLLPLARDYKLDLKDENTYVIIATARVMGPADYEFVDKILGKPDYLISRGNGDIRSGGLLKVKGLQKFFNLKNFRGAEITFYEDNIQYLKTVCDKFGIRGVYIPSKQGH